MCGIVGFAGIGAVCSASRFEASTAALAYRGPDAEGIVGWDAQGRKFQGRGHNVDYTLAMGHRRLSILDLSAAGTQPMVCPHGNWITFNGEIYNYVEIREELKTLGHEFATTTDTEVILAAYAEWGKECVRRFNGMWAFAIYDVARRGVFWSRDRLGVKPFFYSRHDKGFGFASEIPALLLLLQKTPIIDRTQLAKFIVFGVGDDGEETIYRDVRELPPGHCAWFSLDTGEFNIWRFWDLPEEPDLILSDEKALEHFSELLEDSVKIRLRSDVPLAITLSGGTDSSAVAVAASQIGAKGIATITSSFPDHPEIDETAYAQQVARTCGLESVLVQPDMDQLVEEEPLLTRHQATPYGSLSLYVHWAIIKRIKSLNIPVVLSGQGGDELFLGYERYYVAHCLAQFPNPFRMMASAIQASRHSKLGLATMAAYVAFFGSRSLRRNELVRRARQVFNPTLVMAAPELPPAAVGSLRRLQSNEICGQQLRHLLRYDDRTTAAHGMETRLPFLDYRLVEFAYRLPWSHKIRNGWTKYLIRRYLEKHVPATVAWRKRKLGFNAPTVQWTRRLAQRRGAAIMGGSFRAALLRSGVTQFEQIGDRHLWTIYNLLNLSHLSDWRADWT